MRKVHALSRVAVDPDFGLVRLFVRGKDHFRLLREQLFIIHRLWEVINPELLRVAPIVAHDAEFQRFVDVVLRKRKSQPRCQR